MRMLKEFFTILSMVFFINGLALAMTMPKLITLSVPTMNCAMCPLTVKASLLKIQDVNVTSAGIEDGLVKLSYNDQTTDISELLLATKMAGYPSYLVID